MAEAAGIFKHIRNLDRVEFERYFEKKKLSDGATLCKFGEKGDEMFVVLAGRLEVQRPKRKEGEYDVAANLEPGQIAGETALIGQYERNATLVARGETEVLLIKRSTLGKLKSGHPEIAFALYDGILEQVTERFRAVSNKKDTMSFWFS